MTKPDASIESGHADDRQHFYAWRGWRITAWIIDSEFWSANRAEKRIVGPYELVAVDLPATPNCPAEIGWELFGEPNFVTQLATGRTTTFDEAKTAVEAALAKCLSASRLLSDIVEIDQATSSPPHRAKRDGDPGVGALHREAK